MEPITMSLEEIRENFGEDIATKCSAMKDNETQEFNTYTFEGIVVTCHKHSWTSFDVTGENILEEALVLEEEDMELDM